MDKENNNLDPEQREQIEQLTSGQDVQSSETVVVDQQPPLEVLPKKQLLGLPKKALILVVSLVAVLIFGSTLVGADLWYQNPKKVLNDSIVNVFMAKTSIYDLKLDVTNEVGASEQSNFNVQLNAKQINATGALDADFTVTYEGEKYTVGAEALLDSKGDLYFMVKDIKSIVDKFKEEYGIYLTPDISSAIDKIVAKIDGTWLKVSSDDLSTYSEDLKKSKECINSSLNKFKNDKTMALEVKAVYEKNPFIIIDKELGFKDGNFGYEVKGSNQNLKNFLDGFKETALYKDLNTCDSNIKIDTTDMDPSEDISENAPTVTLWVDPWSHRISQISVKDNEDDYDLSLTTLMQYDKKFDITAPSEYISLSDLQSYVEELVKSFYSASYDTVTPEPI